MGNYCCVTMIIIEKCDGAKNSAQCVEFDASFANETVFIITPTLQNSNTKPQVKQWALGYFLSCSDQDSIARANRKVSVG